MKTEPRYYCEKCQWEGTYDDLDYTQTWAGAYWEPPEYECYCPECGNDWENLLDAHDIECCQCCGVGTCECNWEELVTWWAGEIEFERSSKSYDYPKPIKPKQRGLMQWSYFAKKAVS